MLERMTLEVWVEGSWARAVSRDRQPRQPRFYSTREETMMQLAWIGDQWIRMKAPWRSQSRRLYDEAELERMKWRRHSEFEESPDGYDVGIVEETLRRQRAEVEAYMEKEVGALEWGGVVSDPSESTDSEGSEIDLEPRERWEDGPVAVRRRLGQESYQEGQRSRESGSDEGVYRRIQEVAAVLGQESQDQEREGCSPGGQDSEWRQGQEAGS